MFGKMDNIWIGLEGLPEWFSAASGPAEKMQR